MAYYITKSGDMLDQICYYHYGSERYIVKVLEANPSLSDNQIVLRAGVTIYLPEITIPEKIRIRLW